jgi:hypothetical protein
VELERLQLGPLPTLESDVAVQIRAGKGRRAPTSVAAGIFVPGGESLGRVLARFDLAGS